MHQAASHIRRLDTRRVKGLVEQKPWLYRLVWLGSWALWGSRYRVEISGREHVPATGPAVIVPKHQRLTDVPLTGMALGRAQPVYVAKHELFATKFGRWFIGGLGGVALNRQRPIESLASFRRLRELLVAGNLVVVYPEGTYFPDRVGRGKWRLIEMLLRFQEALDGPLDFVPLGIRYFTKRIRGRVALDFGPARHASGPDQAQEFTEALMNDLAGLTGLPRSNECRDFGGGS